MFFKLPFDLIILIYEFEGNIFNKNNKKKYIEYINNNIFNLLYNNYLLDFSYEKNKIIVNNKKINILKNISLDLTDTEKKNFNKYTSKNIIKFCVNKNINNNIVNLVKKITLNKDEKYILVIFSNINGLLNVTFNNSNIHIDNIKTWKDKILYIINKKIDIYFDILIINNIVNLVINNIVFI
jgi:hypothetical protein